VDAGWYSDPNGGPDLRWWDGTAWTEHVNPAAVGHAGAHEGAALQAPPGPTDGYPPPSPGVYGPSAAYAPPQPGMSGEYAPPGMPGGFPPPQRPQPGGGNRTLLIALVALIVVLVGIGGFVLLSGGDDDETSTSTTTTTEDDEGGEPASTTTTADDTTPSTVTGPGGDGETVTAGGLSFTRLDEPWGDWGRSNGEITELSGTAGQFVVVQEEAPSGGQWISNLLLGELASTFSYGGEEDLPATTNAVADTLVSSYYVEGAQSSTVTETEVTIDGRPGYFIHRELTFEQAGLETTREKVVVVLVDTGSGSQPGVFWASIPYNRSDLSAGLDEAYQSLQVVD
jgi:hypothetical protein